MNVIYDANSLYRAYVRSKQNSAWKPQVQSYEMNFLTEIAKTQRELMNQTYKTLEPTHFIINERGKTRPITGEQMRDRVVRHSICDNVLTPTLRKYLIYDNGASLEGKGMGFTRGRILTHLRKYYAANRANKGYVLLIDFSKYYDNIRHDIVLDEIGQHVRDPFTMWLLENVLKSFEVDVSYMNDEQYKNCMAEKFDRLAYWQMDPEQTGEKFMAKSVDIGDQVSQIIGIYYPMRLDNYIKIVKGCKYYGRYMDDSYIIARDRETLEQLLLEIEAIADQLGITINKKKTHIAKLETGFRFLQVRYTLTSTGRVIQQINPKRLTAMRRKLKKLAKKVSSGQLAQEDVANMYRSWLGAHRKLMSRQQVENINTLFNQLFQGGTPT